ERARAEAAEHTRDAALRDLRATAARTTALERQVQDLHATTERATGEAADARTSLATCQAVRDQLETALAAARAEAAEQRERAARAEATAAAALAEQARPPEDSDETQSSPPQSP
ncbi:MAG: hypothetical protein ACRDNL_25575, partial [Spirillospora sp.]